MKKIKILQTRSSIKASKKQKACLLGLGLKKIGSSSELGSTPEVAGMLRVVQHLIKIVD